MKKILPAFLVLFFLSFTAQAQLLIVAIFGDQLNSGKIEFGLDGGYNRTWYFAREDAKGLNNFNLGFFFHIKMTENSTGFISTGVHVKSNVGASGMPTYPIGDPDFDDVYADGELTTKVNVFYVPIMWQQRLGKIYVEGGIQPGMRAKAFDYFKVNDYGGELEYKRDVRDDYTRLDFGMVGGLGYRLKDAPVSASIGMNFYQGVVDVYKPESYDLKNSSLYVYARIPIGAGGGGDK
ncbi:outer membrane beta-barrel protein [Algoriphagus terrigena]|uniref:outer membrane beta-barrel protein n=1 Tax=Algoriphagus terrigena TaxID=344884 RepID=UPI0003F9EB24|nr:outer membrane beta-barrel protein [Algoriphagus terrigena]